MKFELNPQNYRVSEHELLEDLRRVASLGVRVTSKEYRKRKGKYHPNTYVSRFGSWAMALETAGIPSSRKLIDEEILNDLRLVAKALGGRVTIQEYIDRGSHSYNTVLRHFGNWNKALKAAGIAPALIQNVSKEELFANLEKVWHNLGHQPAASEMTRPGSAYSHTTYRQMFGSWKKALAKFVESKNSVSEITYQDKSQTSAGHVYLIQSGKYFKIGKTNDLGRRTKEIAIELPETSIVIHTIQTDDPYGIEAYWHRRFKDRRKNGEWFELSNADVNAFRSKSEM